MYVVINWKLEGFFTMGFFIFELWILVDEFKEEKWLKMVNMSKVIFIFRVLPSYMKENVK